MIFRRPSILLLALVLLGSLLLTGCFNKDKKDETPDTINAPKLTMDLPVSLSGVVASAKPTMKSASQAAGVPNCNYFDPTANFMDNGYNMTKFLVGLSQQQSCFADFLMSAALTFASPFVNQGVITIPDNSDPESPTHVKLAQSGDSYQLWLYFATAGQSLPADTSTLKTIYLTWTTSGTDTYGQFYMVNIPPSISDPDAPQGVRVDFTRTASTAKNEIFLEMRAGHSAGITGFRIDVAQTGIGSSATYEAQGRIEFGSGLPFANLPSSETYATPLFTVEAVSNADGSGAASATYTNFALHLADDGTTSGTPFNLGTYQYTINDTTYFDGAGTIEWRKKLVPSASYINTSGTNTRSGSNVGTIMTCLESYDISCGDMPAMNLGSGYFTNTCTDTNGVDCTSLIQGFYDLGFMGAVTNDTTAEPVDGRSTQLANVSALTTIIPTGSTGTDTFVIPQQ